MTHDDVVKALAFGYPGVAWSYDGDGTTLSPVQGVSQGLVWGGPDPAPTLADLEALLPQLPPPPPSTSAKVAQALAAIQDDTNLDAATREALTNVVRILSA